MITSQIKKLQTQKGQFLIEAVLLTLIGISIMALVVSLLKQGNFVQKLTIEPWQKLQGMIECGVWAPCGITSPAPKLHPSSPSRVLSLDPAGEDG